MPVYYMGVDGNIYQGDPKPGDSIATDVEVAAWFAANPVMPTSVQIQSTGTPAINGTYTISKDIVALITTEETSILATSAFTNGAMTLYWLDNGVLFPNTTIFTAFAKAYAEFVTAAQIAVASKTALPADPVIIA